MRWLPVTFLARADVALSVTLTTISTLLAPILTPALTLPLVERSKDVSAADLFLDVFKIVAAPVALGVVLNRYLPGPTRTYTPLLPLVSVTAIALIVVAVVAVNRESLYTSGLLVAVAVFAHNGTCLALGYGIARLLRFERFSLGCSAQASARERAMWRLQPRPHGLVKSAFVVCRGEVKSTTDTKSTRPYRRGEHDV